MAKTAATITEHPTQILPYRGLGSGIPRTLGEWLEIRFEIEVTGTQFKAVIPRSASATAQLTGEVERLLRAMVEEMSRQQIQSALGLKGEERFQRAYLNPALATQMIEMTLPEKPNSRLQCYRLTASGRQCWRLIPMAVRPEFSGRSAHCRSRPLHCYLSEKAGIELGNLLPPESKR